MSARHGGMSALDGRGRRMLRELTETRWLPAAVRRPIARLVDSELACRLANGAMWSFAGIALSRVLALVAAVVNTRVLGKEAYGELGMVTSTVLMLQAFAGLGMGVTATKHLAELRGSEPVRAGRILALSTASGLITGLVGMVLLWWTAPWLAASALGAPTLAPLLRLSAPGLLFTMLAATENGALAGFEAFRRITLVNVRAGAISVGAAVVGVLLWGLPGAVCALVLGAAVQWALTHVAVRAEARACGVPVALAGAWQERGLLFSYALPLLTQSVLVTPVYWAASAMLVREPQGYSEMGAFSAANQWYSAVLFLASAISSAALPLLSERMGRGDGAGVRTVLAAAMGLNAAVVAPFVIAGMLASPWIMSAYGRGFGDSWPTLVAVLATVAVVAVTNPISNALAASGRVWLGLAINAAWAAVYLGAASWLVQWGALGMAVARLAGYAVYGAWMLWVAARLLARREHAVASAAPVSAS